MPRILVTLLWTLGPAAAAYALKLLVPKTTARVKAAAAPHVKKHARRARRAVAPTLAVVAATPSVKRARSALADGLLKGSWGLSGVARVVVGK